MDSAASLSIIQVSLVIMAHGVSILDRTRASARSDHRGCPLQCLPLMRVHAALPVSRDRKESQYESSRLFECDDRTNVPDRPRKSFILDSARTLNSASAAPIPSSMSKTSALIEVMVENLSRTCIPLE